MLIADIQTETACLSNQSSEFSGCRKVYFNLLCQEPSGVDLDEARRYLAFQLAQGEHLDLDIPADPQKLLPWVESNALSVGTQYRNYLDGRKAGQKRLYFQNRSHALYFLKSVAPTKLVDGAWLYGLLNRWDDACFEEFIRIYLEELGEGVPDKNHVLIYRKLLAAHGCDHWENLDDAYYTQGAIQLAFAHLAAEFLPELIGFNLGYEQLPLHLPVTAYELNELGIDPYYFTLHVTVDNASSGHARKASQGLFAVLPQVGDRQAFYRRVINGYKLNMLGASTVSVIEEFDLREELLAIFAAKSRFGSQMHSDYCRVGGRTVNEWLADPEQIPAFLDKLESAGWIKRHENPENSRFWKLIHGEHADMFGVFNAYERQVIYDWIAGDFAEAGKQRQISFKHRQQLLSSLNQDGYLRHHNGAVRGVLRDHYSGRSNSTPDITDFNVELRTLEDQLANLSGRSEAMAMLCRLMSPTAHHTPSGLMATRIFTRLFNNI